MRDRVIVVWRPVGNKPVHKVTQLTGQAHKLRLWPFGRVPQLSSWKKAKAGLGKGNCSFFSELGEEGTYPEKIHPL